ncbi:hypothetical protein EV356DRAFT_508315 [Viridothelium virens]|uniref:Uncharacterized protein n=1 Tax=Viridothelium virens TaxID=1048519 RepID=A0A6A6GY14_VIRVR|nr:hypothetical protein EV356DRAFT_508315 [Viridothelium virens]
MESDFAASHANHLQRPTHHLKSPPRSTNAWPRANQVDEVVDSLHILKQMDGSGGLCAAAGQSSSVTSCPSRIASAIMSQSPTPALAAEALGSNQQNSTNSGPILSCRCLAIDLHARVLRVWESLCFMFFSLLGQIVRNGPNTMRRFRSGPVKKVWSWRHL